MESLSSAWVVVAASSLACFSQDSFFKEDFVDCKVTVLATVGFITLQVTG
jgi:hypothetical protein